MNRTNESADSWTSTTRSASTTLHGATLEPLPETRGQPVIVLAPVAMPEELPEGFENIDALIEREERDPLKAQALAEGRRIVGERFYGADRQPLTFFRLRHGWSQKHLAERVGTSQSYIARLEAGGVDPQVSTLRRIAAALDVPVAVLIDALPARS